MIPICSFETNADEAERIWSAGIDLYTTVSERLENGAFVFDKAYAMPAYCTATLYLTADAAHVEKVICDILSTYDTASMPSHILCMLPFAIEDFLSYTRNVALVTSWAVKISELLDCVQTDMCTPVEWAMLLGAKRVMLRINAECGLPLYRAALGQEIVTFHLSHFLPSVGLYTEDGKNPSLLLTIMVAALSIMEDTATEKIKKYILEFSYELPREWYGFLYMALYNLEVRDIFYAFLIEGGTPRAQDASSLSGILALIRYLIGVDIGMLGQGIHCQSPCMPSHIGYKLLIPTGKQYLSFEGEEFF